MDEQKEIKEEKPEESTEDSTEGDKHESNPLLDRATEEREGMARENDRREEILKREEKLQIRRELGGTTDAGIKPKKETEDEKYNREAKERYAGTGMDPTPDDTPTTFT